MPTTNVDSYGNLVGGLSQDNWSKRMMNEARYPEDTVFSDWFRPSTAEERQIGHQLLMDKEEPKLKMQGLIAAGINPLTAAAGLAGTGGSSAVPQHAESANPIGDVAGAVGSIAAAGNAISGSIAIMSKLPVEIENLQLDTASKFAGIGLTNAQTQGVLTDNSYKDEDWKSRLNVQRQQFDNMKQELTNMKATHREIMTHCDEMIAQIQLSGSAQEYNEALALKVQEETRWMKELNDWRISHNLHIVESGIDGYIFDMLMNGADLSQFDNFISVYSEYRGQVAFAEQKGSSRAERLYGTSKSPWELGDKYLNRFVQWIRANGEDDPELMKEQIRDVASRLSMEHPDWDRDRIIKELYSFGFSNDEVYNAFK